MEQKGEGVDWFFEGVVRVGLIWGDGGEFGGGGKVEDWKW